MGRSCCGCFEAAAWRGYAWVTMITKDERLRTNSLLAQRPGVSERATTPGYVQAQGAPIAGKPLLMHTQPKRTGRNSGGR